MKLTYEKWLNHVDVIVGATVGCSVHDLPDCDFRDWYEDETSAGQAARWALEEAGFDAG